MVTAPRTTAAVVATSRTAAPRWRAAQATAVVPGRAAVSTTPAAPDGPRTELPPVRQPGGKLVTAFAMEGDLDATAVRSITFTMEWPPRSGRMQDFPEVDRAGWFGKGEAERKILRGQLPILRALWEHLAQEAEKTR